MTELQKEYIRYVREIAHIDGLLQAMLHHISENDTEAIKNCIYNLREYDPGQANTFKTIIEKNEH